MMRRSGGLFPAFWSAAVTSSRPSRTAPSGSPTTANMGSPGERLTSTRTR